MNFIRSKRSKKNLDTTEKSRTAAGTSASTIVDDENQSGNGLSIEYFQIQLLLDCMMRVKYDSSDYEKLIGMFVEQIADDRHDLHMLHEFKNKYLSNRALWWYLQECFLYKILNYSLDSQDLHNLFLFRKILFDIKQQITQNRCSTPLHVYRSQLIPNTLLNNWISSVGQCVVINSFLSATTDPEVALSFLNSSQIEKNDCARVLIEIDADPRIIGSKPFVQIGSLNYGIDKHEVLFMFGSIFMINNITCGDDGVYTIEMTLYSDNDHDFKQVFEDMKKKYGDGEIDLLAFARLLYDLERYSEAEEYTKCYLEELPSNHEDAIRCCNLLGLIALTKTDFKSSLIWYNQTLEFQTRLLPEYGNLKIADTHENIGDVYWKQGSHDLALKHYLNSLEIKKAITPPQHKSIAATLENIGRIYESKKDSLQALDYFQKAKSVYRRESSTTHDKLAQIDEHMQRISQNLK